MLVSRNLLRQSVMHFSSAVSSAGEVMVSSTHFLKHMSVNWVTDVWILALADSCWMYARISCLAAVSKCSSSALSTPVLWFMSLVQEGKKKRKKSQPRIRTRMASTPSVVVSDPVHTQTSVVQLHPVHNCHHIADVSCFLQRHKPVAHAVPVDLVFGQSDPGNWGKLHHKLLQQHLVNTTVQVPDVYSVFFCVHLCCVTRLLAAPSPLPLRAVPCVFFSLSWFLSRVNMFDLHLLHQVSAFCTQWTHTTTCTPPSPPPRTC